MKAVAVLFAASCFLLVPSISNSYKVIQGLQEDNVATLTIGNGLAASAEFKETPLHSAVRVRDSKKIKDLAKEGADMYATDSNGWSPMHLAIEIQDVEMIMDLVRCHFNVNKRFKGRRTVLMHAAASGSLKAVEVLYEVGARLDSIDDHGNTAMSEAVLAGRTNVVKLLLRLGANPNVRFPKGNTYLHIAVDKDEFDMVRLFVELGTFIDLVNDDGDTPVFIAIKNDNPAIINYLAHKRADLSLTDSRGNTYLHKAVTENSFQALEALLEGDVPLLQANNKGETAFFLATGTNNTEVIDMFIDSNVNINRTSSAGKNYLHEAVEGNSSSVSTVEKLLNKGVSVDALTLNNETALTIAVRNNNFQLCELLINRNADLKKRTLDGKSYAMIAIENRAWRSARALMYHGYITEPSVDERDKYGENALLHAVKRDDKEGVMLLVDLGADISQVYEQNNLTLIHEAASYGSVEVTKWLLEKGFDVNSKDLCSQIPLHYACAHGELPEVVVLVERKSCINCLTASGKSALWISDNWKHPAISLFLRSNGAIL